MYEGNVVQRLDRPEIVSHEYYRVPSQAWTCSTCELAVTSPEPISRPPQCRRCGGIVFEMARAEPQ